jgi:hypothetical protein
MPAPAEQPQSATVPAMPQNAPFDRPSSPPGVLLPGATGGP